MSSLSLSKYFMGVAAKHLSAVEVDPRRSRQHEFNGVQDLKEILGTDRREFAARFIFLGENEEQTLTDDDTLTWYDSREKQEHRSAEYRLYYKGNAVLEQAAEGDLLVIGKREGDNLLVIIAKAKSTAESQVLWLCGVDDPSGNLFKVKDLSGGGDERQGYAAKSILDQLGVEVEETPAREDEVFLQDMNKIFDRAKLMQGKYPLTKIFSGYARDTLPSVSPLDDPDAALMCYMEREERLFRILEKQFVMDKLRKGFDEDVDVFVDFALSTLNRRKSRVGYAFENHVEWIFQKLSLRYSRNPKTEKNVRPDFIFPSIDDYRNAAFPESRLSMLGVKFSCKDRWRQITTEADRIEQKHLATMESAISEAQTDEMKGLKVMLVLPAGLHDTYKPTQKDRLIGVRNFIELARSRELGVSPAV